MKRLDSFTTQYLVTALWAECLDDGEPFDSTFDITHLSADCLKRAIADCAKFQADNAADLQGIDPTDAGHDFWLTRNRHGAGFWDGDYPKDIGKRLTDSAHTFGEVYLYVTDDGKVDAA